jgi:diguanylate cyclase (GGDEF)-like protein
MNQASPNTLEVQQENIIKLSNTNGRRSSLATIIYCAFIGIVFLFMTAMALSYYRIISFQSVLSNITNDVLPEIVHSTDFHNQINNLFYLHSQLVNANNQASLRIAKNSIEDKLQYIDKQITSRDSNAYLSTQFKVITHEFSNLYDLIKQHLYLREKIQMGQNQMFILHESMFKLLLQSSQKNSDNIATMMWVLTYSEIVTLTNRGLTTRRLQSVRQTQRQVNSKIDSLKQNLISLPLSEQKKAQALTTQLQQLWINEDGLLLLKLKEMRIIGRVIGRGNFVKNLLGDFSRVAEFKTYRINEEISKKTIAISDDVATEIKLLSFASLIMLFFIFWLIHFIKNRFIERVVTLKKSVLARHEGKDTKFDISGNDEITDIAKAVNSFAEQLEDQKQTLHDLSLTDGLTGLPNRRAMDQRLSHDLHMVKRNQSSVTVMLIDIDFFKKYNDLYGHLAGDDCLKTISTLLLRCKKRASDFVARYGGEEFLFILPCTNQPDAHKFAENIIAQVNRLKIKHHGSNIADYVTLSIGMATLSHQSNLDISTVLGKADNALYDAKKTGRNRICHYP